MGQSDVSRLCMPKSAKRKQSSTPTSLVPISTSALNPPARRAGDRTTAEAMIAEVQGSQPIKDMAVREPVSLRQSFGFPLFIEEPDASQLNLRLALIDTTVKDYAPCLMPQADDPELTSRSTSISA